MQKPKKINPLALIAAIAFGAFAIMFFATNQVITGLFFAFFTFVFVIRINTRFSRLS